MPNLASLAKADNDQSRTEYATRLIEVPDSDKILPYVRAVLSTVGDGSAHVVKGKGKEGILLTAPIGVSHFLDSVIKTDLSRFEGLAEFEQAIVYSPSFSFPAEIDGDDLLALVHVLKLIPPDMNCDKIQMTPDRGVLFISGPSDRKEYFKDNVLPSINQMIHLLEKPGFPSV